MSNLVPTPPYPNVIRVATACLTIWILYIAQELIIPITIAMFISFVLAPIIRKLKKMGVPASIGSAVVTTCVGLVALGLVALTSSQLLDLSQRLPEYRENLIQRVRSVKSSTGHSLGNLQRTVSSIQHELNRTTAPSETPTVAAVAVKVIDQDTNDWFASITSYISPALHPLTQCSVVMLLLFFILLSMDSIAIKSQRFARRFDLYQASEAIRDAASTLGDYLRAQLFLNLGYGIAVGLTMFFFGLPNALMWGILAALLRYLPYVGPTVAIVMPTLLCVAISPDWSHPIGFLATMLGIELVLNVVIEPMFYGHRTGVSSLGVVVSTLFWGWLWGAAGLILAMPITACLVVIGKHLRPLEAVAELLGTEDAPAAEPIPEVQSIPEQPKPTTPIPQRLETLPS